MPTTPSHALISEHLIRLYHFCLIADRPTHKTQTTNNTAVNWNMLKGIPRLSPVSSGNVLITVYSQRSVNFNQKCWMNRRAPAKVQIHGFRKGWSCTVDVWFHKAIGWFQSNLEAQFNWRKASQLKESRPLHIMYRLMLRSINYIVDVFLRKIKGFRFMIIFNETAEFLLFHLFSFFVSLPWNCPTYLEHYTSMDSIAQRQRADLPYLIEVFPLISVINHL